MSLPALANTEDRVSVPMRAATFPEALFIKEVLITFFFDGVIRSQYLLQGLPSHHHHSFLRPPPLPLEEEEDWQAHRERSRNPCLNFINLVFQS